MDVKIGTQIGRYTVLEKLGSGGMATVYNAFDRVLERNVALKLILPSRQTSDIFLERFKDEAESLARLSHTNIVKVYDFGEDNGSPYLVMEYIRCGTLRDLMDGPIPWQEAAEILAPLARALEYVHNQKIVHRDIKPANILIDDHGRPRLSDFGIATMIEENETAATMTGVGVGTPEYMSPEQASGHTVGFQADIYSLGIVFFELVTGRKPFTAETPMGVVIKQVKNPMPRPGKFIRGLPPTVEEVIMKATAKRPDGRFKDMAVFADVLEELTAGEKADFKKIRDLTGFSKSSKNYFILPAAASLLMAALLFGIPLLRPYLFPTQIPTAKPIVIVIKITATPGPPKLITATEIPPGTALVSTRLPTRVRTSPTPSATQQPKIEYVLRLENQELPEVQVDSSGYLELAQWGHGNANSISISPDSSQIAVGTTNGVYFYDRNDLSRTNFINASSWVNAIVFSPGGDSIIVGSKADEGQAVNKWDLALGTLSQEYEIKFPMNFNYVTGDRTPDALALEYSSHERYLGIGYSNGVTDVWDETSGKILYSMGQLGTVTDLAFSHDNRYLATAGDKEVKIWDMTTGTLLNIIPQSGSISAVMFTHDDRAVMIAGSDWTIRMYQFVDLRLIKAYTGRSAVSSLALNADGDRLVAGFENGDVAVINAETLTEIYKFQHNDDGVRGVASSSDNQFFVTSSWKQAVRMWDLSSGSNLGSLAPNIPEVVRMAFSPDSKWLAVGSSDEKVRLWDVKKGEIMHTLEGHIPEGTPFSNRGDYLIVARDPDISWQINGQLQMWSTDSQEIKKTLTGYQHGWYVSFSVDDKLLVSGDTNRAEIWDTSTYLKLRTHSGTNAACGVFLTPDNQVVTRISAGGIIFENSAKIDRLCASNDYGKTRLLGVSPEYSYAVLRPEKGTLFAWGMDSLNTDAYQYMDYYDTFLGFSPDGKKVVFGSRQHNLINLGYSANLTSRVLRFNYFNEYNFKAAVSSDNRYVAFGSRDGSISVWGSPIQ